MKTIGITGGSGFIASHVADVLISRGYGVLSLDHTNKRTPGAPNVPVFLGDVRDATSVTEFAAHVDGIIHLAAVLGTQETIYNPVPAVETNLIGSLNVLNAAAQYDLPVVYAGVGNHWMREHAGGAYTITKTSVEDFIKTYNVNKGTRVSVVRPVNAYGPRQSVAAPFGSSKVRKIMPSFICRALTGEDIELYGGGVQTSDCIHVYDVAEAFVRALEYTNQNGPLETAAEIGPSVSHTVREIAEMVREAAESDSEITSLPMRPGEVPNAVVSADLSTLSPLGLDPSNFVPLEEGIRGTVDWYRHNWLPGYLESQKDSEE